MANVVKSGIKVLATTVGTFIGGPKGTVAGAVIGELAEHLISDLDGAGMLRIPIRQIGDDELPPSQLLRAEYQVLKFRGRRAVIDDLWTWIGTERDVDLRLYYGPGGMGKTRLMIQWCLEMLGSGWIAGFLDRDPARLTPDNFDALAAVKRHLCIVVDYAETRTDSVARLIRVAREKQRDRKVRIILLARKQGDWWSKLSEDDEATADFLARTGEGFALPPLASSAAEAEEKPAQIFADAVAAYGTVLKRDVPAVTPPDFSHPDFETMLIIQLAALSAILGDKDLATADASSLLERVIDHERRYWRDHMPARDLAPTLLDGIHQAAALATLAGISETTEDASALVLRAPLLSDQPAHVTNAVAGFLGDLYAGDSVLNGVQPDILGEHLVALAADADGSLVDAFFGGEALGDGQLEHGLVVLTRLTQRDSAHDALLARAFEGDDRLHRLGRPGISAAVATGDPLGQLMAERLESAPDPGLALELVNDVPQDTVALLELGWVTTEQALQSIPDDSEDIDNRARRAGILNDVAIRRRAVGQHETALDAILEAVQIRRELAHDRPGVIRPELARSLNNLSTMLIDLGQHESALDAIQEAINIYHDLARDHPVAFRPNLATALNNFATTLNSLGQLKPALHAIQEAVDIYRNLVREYPDVYLANLAGSLNNLSTIFSKIRQYEPALDAIREAVSIRRELVRKRPDAFRPHLADSLNNQANRFSDIGRQPLALKAIHEAVDIYRNLARERPDSFQPNLAGSLNNLANKLSDIGRRKPALDAVQQAVGIHRELARRRPNAFRPSLAASLNNLANKLGEIGQRKSALAAIREAVEIRRDLARERPSAFRPYLAESLNNLSNVLTEFDQHEHALNAIEEAVGIHRELVNEHPEAFLPDLSMSLNNLAATLSELRRCIPALDAIQEAVDIRRELAREHPGIFRPDIGESLNNLSGILRALGQYEPAVAAIEEAIGIYRDLAHNKSDAFYSHLARSLGVYCQVLNDVGRYEEAVDTITEGIEVLREPFLELPLAHARLMATMLQDYENICTEIGRTIDADLVDHIVAVFEEL